MTISAFAELAFGELPAAYDNSVANPFRALLEDPEAQLIYLIEAYPYNGAQANTLSGEAPFGSASFGEFDVSYTGGEEPVYLSDAGFITEPSDSPANRYFMALVDNPLQFEVSILSGGDFGAQPPSFGSITIKNGGDLDGLEGYYWNGRRIVVRAGSRDFPYSSFATVFDGMINGLEADDENLTLTITDNSLKTDQVIQATSYAGTGGLEGGEDLVSKPKPICYGKVFNIEPVLVDAANLIYQVHDGSIDAVARVLDSGVALANGGDVADITAATVIAGHYKTQLSGGYIKLGSTPGGRITADIQGRNAGGYVDKAGDIINSLVSNYLGARSFLQSEIDTASFNRLNAELTGSCGVYVTDKVALSGIIDELLTPCGAYWTFTRQGMLFAGFIDEPGTATLTLTEDDIEDDGVQIASVIPPSWRVSVGYAPVWTVQKEDELAGATLEADRTFLGEQYRYVVSESRSVRTQNAQSFERVFNTNLAVKADAEALLARLSKIYQTQRRVYRVIARRVLFRAYVGDTISLTYPRFDLTNGKNLLVVGVAEDAETGTTTFELWG